MLGSLPPGTTDLESGRMTPELLSDPCTSDVCWTAQR